MNKWSFSFKPPWEYSLYIWAFARCPKENECANDNDNCDANTEDCLDEQIGFSCVCKKGYRRNDVTRYLSKLLPA